MEREHIIGRWRFAGPALRGGGPFEDHAIEFTASGDYVISILGAAGIGRTLLTYRLDGYTIIVDQPARPREERMPIIVTLDDELILDEGPASARYVREDPGRSCDPSAALYALANHALREALGNAGGGEPFIPFLMWHEGDQRQCARFLSSTPVKAEEAARAHAAALPATVEACAFAYDGYLTVNGDRHDAAFAAASRRTPGLGLVTAQAYAAGPSGVRGIGPIATLNPITSWLR